MKHRTGMTNGPCGLEKPRSSGQSEKAGSISRAQAWLRALLAATCLGPVSGLGAMITADYTGLNLSIPDGDLSGVQNSQSITGAGSTLQSLEVRLQISGRGGAAFNGDLYAYLAHDTGLAILLNRPGRRADSDYGYSDSGIDVAFDSSLTTPDVHTYRLTISGSHTTPLSGPLTGTWAADGRDEFPYDVLDTDARTAPLSVFHGLDPNGTWTLFVADAETGGAARLDGWGMTLYTGSTDVPETGPSAILISLGMLGLAATRKHWAPRLR